jgi:hypothetical protein
MSRLQDHVYRTTREVLWEEQYGDPDGMRLKDFRLQRATRGPTPIGSKYTFVFSEYSCGDES